jgi:hypothetical protein
MWATGRSYRCPCGSTWRGWLTPSPSRNRSSNESARTRAAFAVATGSRPQMFAMSEATRMRSVAASSTAPFANDSRVPSPSGYQRVS